MRGTIYIFYLTIERKRSHVTIYGIGGRKMRSRGGYRGEGQVGRVGEIITKRLRKSRRKRLYVNHI
jgi:hypothetical protein